jgi:hypothetical protein
MASTFRTLRNDDNLVVLEQLNRMPETGSAVDPEEVVGLAEYLVPLRGAGGSPSAPSDEAVEAIVEWADGDPHTLRRAWMLGVHRCGAHDVGRGALDLLATALHLAEERLCEKRAPRAAPREAQPRVRVSRHPSGSVSTA